MKTIEPLHECPFWSSWEAGSCSKTCGAGKIIERRTCRRRIFASGKNSESGKGMEPGNIETSMQDCEAEFGAGLSERAIYCHIKECETQWSSWEKCPKRCDGRTKQEI